MHYLIFLLVAVAIGFVAYKLVTAQDDPPSGPRRDVPRGPDDDPDFMRNL